MRSRLAEVAANNTEDGDTDLYRVDVSAAGNYTATASVTSDLQPGTYYLRVDNVGYGDPLSTGYSTYGSRGAHSLTVAPS